MIGIVVGLRAEARIAGHLAARLGARIEVGGGDAAGAADAVRRLVDAGAERLISFGLAGGLDPALSAGAVVVASRILLDRRVIQTDATLNALLRAPGPVTLLAADTLAVTAADKRQLHAQTGAAAIDLETAAVARAGLPFAVLRAICDPAGRSLPPAALAALDSTGAVRLRRVLRAMLAQPTQLPALLRLARDAATARAALRDHIALIEARR